MNNRTGLHSYELVKERKGQPPLYREGFYILSKEDGTYWLGHQFGRVGEYHQVPVSKEFYESFLKEKQRLEEKHNKIFGNE